MELPKITIPLDSGAILLCVWLGWKIWYALPIPYGSPGFDDFILVVGVILVILNRKESVKK